MSGNLRVVGYWKIDPGVPFRLWKDVQIDEDKALLRWAIEEEQIETDDGLLLKRMAVGITTEVPPHYGDQVRDTGIEAQLDKFNHAITWAAHTGPYQTVTGEIQVQGPEFGHITVFTPMEPTGGESPYSYYKRKAVPRFADNEFEEVMPL
jgi:hypothetical protein